MYAIFAHTYPTHVRAVGTGFAIGVGRGGAVLGPTIAGLLLDGGFDFPMAAWFMSAGSLIAAVALLFLRLRKEPPELVKAEGATVSPPQMATAATATALR